MEWFYLHTVLAILYPYWWTLAKPLVQDAVFSASDPTKCSKRGRRGETCEALASSHHCVRKELPNSCAAWTE